ncbi:MAG TPA: TIGR02587 family membrane protein [Allosphingosinicella sp.]|nr:TIGR02587 family membrane protein [Allosphingosinicella sp.]
MATSSKFRRAPAGANRRYAVGLARALAGAIIFGLPLLMTMEMWALGFSTHPLRLLLFLALNFFILVGLSRFGGFERTYGLGEDVLDAFAAYGVGVVASVAVLSLFGVLGAGMPLDELIGKVAIQSVPGSFGAMLARKQLTGGESEPDEAHALRSEGYGGQLFLMLAGALFLAFNVAPTEEMALIGFLMSPWHGIALVVVSLLLLDALAHGLGFAGQKPVAEGVSYKGNFMRYSVVGYGIALIVSFYVLWTFGQTDGASPSQVAGTVTVLAFPAAIGAAIARLVV